MFRVRSISYISITKNLDLIIGVRFQVDDLVSENESIEFQGGDGAPDRRIATTLANELVTDLVAFHVAALVPLWDFFPRQTDEFRRVTLVNSDVWWRNDGCYKSKMTLCVGGCIHKVAEKM